MTPLSAESEDVPHGGRRAARLLAAVLLLTARLRPRPAPPEPPPERSAGEREDPGEPGGPGEPAEQAEQGERDGSTGEPGRPAWDPADGAARPDRARVARRSGDPASGTVPGVTAAETELLLRVSEVASELALRAVTEDPAGGRRPAPRGPDTAGTAPDTDR